MKKLAPRDPANVAAVQEVIDRVRPDWLNKPNIVEVGLAIKITNGVPQGDTLSIRFFVQEKASEEECRARGWQVIPKEIEEIPTDVTAVVVAPHQVLETRSQRYDTLVGGITVGNTKLNSVGTLAAVLFHNDDGRAVGLTNEHVIIFNIDGQIDDPVAQPSFGFGAQVGIVDAACCPGGQVSFRDVPNPLADVAAGVFVGAVIAAAASDEIDPHRRGQEATPVSDGERTLRERVRMKIDYNELPLPGTPYRLGVDWTYERETDLQTLTHNITETRQNPHVLRKQQLLTDRHTYLRGQKVHFLAALGVDNGEKRCPDYHVVAHAISPAKSHARRSILRPARGADLESLKEIFEEFQPEQPLTTRCVRFAEFEVGQDLGDEFTHMMFEFRALGNLNIRVVDTMPRPVGDGVGELMFPDAGMEVILADVAEEVTAEVATFTGDAVTLRAFDESVEVGSDTSGGQQGIGYRLHVRAPRITRLLIEGGGGEGVLLELCSTRPVRDHHCYYWGSIALSPMEETGLWSTYLFVQTLNDVPPDIEPTVAAQTIGGLIASDNFTAGGRVSNIAYGDICPIDAAANGDFEVTIP